MAKEEEGRQSEAKSDDARRTPIRKVRKVQENAGKMNTPPPLVLLLPKRIILALIEAGSPCAMEDLSPPQCFPH